MFPKKTKVNQWRNTSTVIDWFKNLVNKQKRKFIKFEIAEFYPSASQDLLKKSINCAKSFTTIEENGISATKHELMEYELRKVVMSNLM